MLSFFRARRWYWVCQLVGWSGFVLTQVQAYLVLKRYTPSVVPRMLLGAVLGMLLTHAYRALLLRFEVLRARVGWQLGVALLGLVGLSVGLNVIYAGLSMLAKANPTAPPSDWSTFAFSVVGMGRYLIVWILAYHFFALGEWLAHTQVRQLQAEAAHRQTELDLLRSQINPHFLFNALNSVRALALPDPHRARTAVTQLADLLRYTLNYEQRQLIPLADELAAVRDYLALEQTRFGPERLRVEVAVPEALLAWPVPPAALLTLVENAVKHGISARPAGGALHLTATAPPAGPLHLAVSQPGHLPASGASPARHTPAPRGGLGLANTRQRLRALYGDAASLTLGEEPAGTVVARLDLPAAITTPELSIA